MLDLTNVLIVDPIRLGRFLCPACLVSHGLLEKGLKILTLVFTRHLQNEFKLDRKLYVTQNTNDSRQDFAIFFLKDADTAFIA